MFYNILINMPIKKTVFLTRLFVIQKVFRELIASNNIY